MRSSRSYRGVFVALFLGLAGSVSAAACGGDPVGGDCAVKVNCLAADCKTTVRENACICPDGSKTADQCATPAADAGTKADATSVDGASDSSASDSATADAAMVDGAPNDATVD